MILEKAMSQQQIQQFLDSNGGVAVVDCYATWCGPCNKISPYVHKKHEQTKIPLITVDVDQAEGLTAAYEINAMPTFLVIVDQWNNITEKIVGGDQTNVDKAYNIAVSHKKK